MPENGTVVTLASRRPKRLSQEPAQPEAPRALGTHPGPLRLNTLQSVVLRAAQRRWGAGAVAILKTLADAGTRQVDEWLHRLPYYFDQPADLIHCRPLPVRRIRHDELIRRAVADPLNCWLLVLVAHRGPVLHPHREGIDYGVPWLPFIGDGTLVASDLVLNRRSYLAVEDPRLARALFDNLPRHKNTRTKGQLFSPQGELIAGEPQL